MCIRDRVTPNLDQLAKTALRFEYAYCQMSVCSPSRQSFMTSRRPDKSQVWNFIDANPLDSPAVPGHFKDAGYLTLGLGKTFHEANGAWNADKYWDTDVLPYYPYSVNQCPKGGEGGGHCVEADSSIWDFSLRNKSVEYLRFAADNYHNTTRPFFMMSGFRDPHAPWAAPQRMYDLYNESAIAVASQQTLGQGSPLIAWSSQLSVQLQNGTHFPFAPDKAVPDWVARDQRHAYYAAVSYVDEHMGVLLSELDSAGLTDNTIVVVHSDHGYQLGEHGFWEKKSNFDLAVRVPLLIRAPNRPASHGKTTGSYTELVDLFPTVVSLAGLPAQSGSLDGTDVSKLFDEPSLQLKDRAYHQYPACNMKDFNQTRGACNNTPKDQFFAMGYSVRTPDWRYNLWVGWNQSSLSALWDGETVEELYDHKGDLSDDMDAWENSNLALSNPTVVKQLRAEVRAFFTSSE
eukprot:TRINITY_DN40092_c0_g1_i1.p1 TRINITY_DN40092_c0_g1~~TRINITY_DN40092_c0_g1_i1.p1  ORF type:complete len:459 (+),score=126.85 TRINITY_DN40092_c0_g1_i1:86-1462(+)